MNFILTEKQKERYSRQIRSPLIGEEGQEKLSNIRVLQIGLGGLGSPCSLYLTAAGIKELTIIDNDILDISLIEANQLTINKKYFSLNALMNEIYEFFKLNRLIHNKVQLHVSMGFEDKSDVILSDGDRIKQVLNNLIYNAFKFTESGKIEFGYSRYNQNELLFYVKDTGVGISNEFKNKLFQRFQQDNNQKVNNYEGTGLGLAISKGIIDL